MKPLVACLFALALVKCASAQNDRPQNAAPPVARVRLQCPIRLGGVFTRGLADNPDWQEDSAEKGVKLSEANRRWMAQNCDVAAFPAVCLNPDTYPKTLREQTLFTPLLLAFASTLSEQPNVWGDVGGWQPRMAAWTLRDRAGKEIPPPQENTHWMDFANLLWEAHWQAQMLKQTQAYGAYGAVISELPVANTAVGDNLAKYRNSTALADATGDWLRAVKKGNRFFVIPSALGFDRVAGHATLPTPPGTERPDLRGSLWDEYYTASDGAWDEGFLLPYWTDVIPSEDEREMRLQAADRAGAFGQTYIAAGAYHNDAELEFLLASYLLVARRQGRMVFQPMPISPLFDRDDAGRSFAVFKQQILSRRAYFDVPLGYSTRERFLVAGLEARVWRRDYSHGAVYVNSEDERSVTLRFAAEMRRVTGEKIREITLPPRSGLILLNSDVTMK